MMTSAEHLGEIIDVLAEIGQACSTVSVFGLTAREEEIFRDLYISEHTVAHHVTHIFRKIGVDNRTLATAFAIRRGITHGNEE